jgi:hypothetical protein
MHALTLSHAIVTDNEREFMRVDDLAIENWLGLQSSVSALNPCGRPRK